MKLTRYDLMLWIVAIAMFLMAWQPADAVTPVTTQPPSALFISAAYAGDYYEVQCPDAGDVCSAGGSGITRIKRTIH
jgi:hypothetical protein